MSGTTGTPFAGLAARFDESVAPFQYPDVIAPAGGAETLVEYATDDVAAVGWRSGSGGVVYFAFTIDGLDDTADRRAIAAAALAYLDR